jgi:hypothetical protein
MSVMRNHFWLFVALCVTLVVSACGAGGTPSPTGMMTTDVVIDTQVPAVGRANIVQMVSPVDATGNNANIQIPSLGGDDETMVMGVNSTGNIMLAALTNKTPTVLSVDSTALALVRLALGALPSEMTSAQVNQLNAAIRTTSEYTNLLSLVGQALNAGNSPAQDTGVLQCVLKVIDQFSTALPTVTTHAQALQPLLLAAVSPPTVPGTLQLPYTLITSGGSAGLTIQLQAADTSGNVPLTNNTTISWNASSKDLQGQPLSTDLLLNGRSYSLNLLGIFSGTISPSKPQAVNGNSGDFYVTVNQTGASHRANVTSIVRNTTALALSLIPTQPKGLLGPCTDAVASVVLNPSAIDVLVGQPSADNLLSLLASGVGPKNWTNIGSVMTKCAGPQLLSVLTSQAAYGMTLQLAGYIGKYMNPIGQYLAAYDMVKAAWTASGNAVKGVSLVVQILETITTWDPLVPYNHKTVGVCEVANVIVDCTTRLEISIPTQAIIVNQTSMQVGAVVPLTVTAFGSSNTQTITPANLKWGSSAGTVAWVDFKGVVTGVSEGNTDITVTDPLTGVTSAAFTVIVLPNISATADTTAQNLNVGTPMTNFIPLTSSGGKAPYTYSVTSGSLPAGLSLDSSTGVVSGTPTTTYPSADVVFSVTDANNVVASTTSTVNFTVSGIVTYTTNKFGVDDNLTISLIDATGVPTVIWNKGFGVYDSFSFQARTGDSLHIVVSDNNGGACYSFGGLSPGEGFTIVNPQGVKQELIPIVSQKCDGIALGPSPYIYVDQTVIIGI